MLWNVHKGKGEWIRVLREWQRYEQFVFLCNFRHRKPNSNLFARLLCLFSSSGFSCDVWFCILRNASFVVWPFRSKYQIACNCHHSGHSAARFSSFQFYAFVTQSIVYAIVAEWSALIESAKINTMHASHIHNPYSLRVGTLRLQSKSLLNQAQPLSTHRSSALAVTHTQYMASIPFHTVCPCVCMCAAAAATSAKATDWNILIIILWFVQSEWIFHSKIVRACHNYWCRWRACHTHSHTSIAAAEIICP